MTPQQNILCGQLRDHLDAEVAVHRRLVQLAESKHRQLMAADITGFQRTLAEEHGTLGESGRLRQSRERLLRGLAALFNLQNVEIRLSLILERVIDPVRSQLAERQRELASLLERLRSLTERNQVLIRSSLDLVRDIMQAVLGTPNSGSKGYDRRGWTGYQSPGSGNLVNMSG